MHPTATRTWFTNSPHRCGELGARCSYRTVTFSTRCTVGLPTFKSHANTVPKTTRKRRDEFGAGCLYQTVTIRQVGRGLFIPDRHMSTIYGVGLAVVQEPPDRVTKTPYRHGVSARCSYQTVTVRYCAATAWDSAAFKSDANQWFTNRP